jgi:hypothetical protein
MMFGKSQKNKKEKDAKKGSQAPRERKRRNGGEGH